MVSSRRVLITLLLAAVLCAAWSTQDQEIFEIVARLQRVEKNDNFYNFLGLKNGMRSTNDEINRAYRRKSLELHPDKNKGKTNAQERFTILGLITPVLRDPRRRERYDNFLTNGFPMWRGTNYLYARWRPGIGSVILFLMVVSTLAHYGAMVLTCQRQRSHFEELIRDSRAKAWATNNGLPTSNRKSIILEDTGREFVVEVDGSVAHVAPNGDLVWLNVDELPRAEWKKTFVVQLCRGLYSKITGQEQLVDTVEHTDEKADVRIVTGDQRRLGNGAQVVRMEKQGGIRRTKGRR